MKWFVRVLVLALWVGSLDIVFGMGVLVGMFDPKRGADSVARAFQVLTLGAGYEICGGEDPLQCGYRDTTARQEVSCENYLGDRSVVLMTFGQSNSANAGKDRYIPVGDVANFNIFDGKCYQAEDPLLGPDANGGSVWGVLGDKLIAAGDYDRVLILPFGIGGSSLSQWQEEGVLFPLLQTAMRAINEAAIDPDYILWHQGESDAGQETAEQDYFDMFEALVGHLRNGGFNAPIYPAVATYCEFILTDDDPAVQEARNTVRAAQQRLPEIDGVYPGPDTDEIRGELYRHDNCHFNAKGMQAHARAWREAVF